MGVGDRALDALGQYVDHLAVQVVLLAEFGCQTHWLIAWLRTDVDLAAILELDLQLNQRPTGTWPTILAVISL
jgi:hypothetical protein